MAQGQNADEGVTATIPEYGMKTVLLTQYTIAYNTLVDYMLDPKAPGKKKEAKSALLKLALPLYTKLYVLGRGWDDKRDYVAYFFKNPQEISESESPEADKMDLMALFLILQRVLEMLGITKFEKAHLAKTEMYKEE